MKVIGSIVYIFGVGCGVFVVGSMIAAIAPQVLPWYAVSVASAVVGSVLVNI